MSRKNVNTYSCEGTKTYQGVNSTSRRKRGCVEANELDTYKSGGSSSLMSRGALLNDLKNLSSGQVIQTSKTYEQAKSTSRQ